MHSILISGRVIFQAASLITQQLKTSGITEAKSSSNKPTEGLRVLGLTLSCCYRHQRKRGGRGKARKVLPHIS